MLVKLWNWEKEEILHISLLNLSIANLVIFKRFSVKQLECNINDGKINLKFRKISFVIKGLMT